MIWKVNQALLTKNKLHLYDWEGDLELVISIIFQSIEVKAYITTFYFFQCLWLVSERSRLEERRMVNMLHDFHDTSIQIQDILLLHNAQNFLHCF